MTRTGLMMLALAALLALAPQASPAPPLMPMPSAVRYGEGHLRLDSTFTVATAGFRDARLVGAIGRSLARLEHRIAQPLGDSVGRGGPATLRVEVTGAGESVQSPLEDESYTLKVSGAGIDLRAATVVGAIRGLATLEQLVLADGQGFYLPVVRIGDRPRFPWRGLLLDVGRHFMPPEVVRRTLDGMAAVKLNVLHWHLSEDQGFRVESRRHPKLHRLGSDGLYYTQDEIREIVAYARDRGIRVLPEFDMPGHSTSWFVGYPEHASVSGPYAIERRFGVHPAAFDPTRDETYDFLDAFVAEMAELFPDRYWHIGGDEVMGKHWNENPRIARFKRERGLRDNEALQAHFNQRLAHILSRHGKRMVGWDEILHDHVPPGTVIQSWRGTEYLSRAARQGLAGILSAPYYLDHMKPADEHYLADPLPPNHGLSDSAAARVLGGEACMWAEQVNPETVDSRIWPRLAAIAERFWSPAEVRDVGDMYRRLSLVSIQLERLGLSHEAHSDRMLRLLTGERGVEALHDLLAYTMPATFGERMRIQGTTQLTPLTRLVDAARPDPWSRSTLMQLATALTANPRESRAEAAELRRILTEWQSLHAAVIALVPTVPLAAEGEPAARALGELGQIGLAALDALDGNDDGGVEWQASARARLDELAMPQGLLRLAGVEAVQILVGAK